MPAKPLGHKAYGSIPHLPGSKRGPGDHGLEEKQAAILTDRVSKEWTITIQEKLDGSCMSVAKVNGEIIALGRAGFPASTSPYMHLRAFAQWVADRRDRFDALLAEGDRVVGEWLLMATATRYWIPTANDLFVVFDIMRGHDRIGTLCLDEVITHGICAVRTLGVGPMPPENAFTRARQSPRFAAESLPEGVIYRAYKHGKLSFLGKWTRSDFEPGRYLGLDVYNYPLSLVCPVEAERFRNGSVLDTAIEAAGV